MSGVNDHIECECYCHNPETKPWAVHDVACCYVCEWCGRRIVITFQELHGLTCKHRTIVSPVSKASKGVRFPDPSFSALVEGEK